MWLDLMLLVLGVAFLVVGFLGAILPLPGPPLSFVGLLLLHITRFADFNERLLWLLGLVTIVVAILDYYVPIWGLKKFGGSKWGVWGSTIGLIVGMFMGPMGIFVGTFLGGLIGELSSGKNTGAATIAALGSFAGFMVGVVMKVALCGLMIWYAVVALF